jgi:hypothetical protein
MSRRKPAANTDVELVGRGHTRQTVHNARRFDTDGGEAPLARAVAWVEANSVQTDNDLLTPMVVVAIESDVGRQFLAIRPDALWRYMTNASGDSDRHLHELVPSDAPCRLFVDLEYEFDKDAKRDRELRHTVCASSRVAFCEALERNAAGFVRALCAEAKRQYGGVELEPFVMRSHKPSKWSMHVVFSGAIWRSASHCRAFVLQVMEMRSLLDPLVTHYVDRGVYDSNHFLRMYRCTKRAEPRRSILAEGDSFNSPIDEERWRRSLITCFPFSTPTSREAGEQAEQCTALFLRQHFESLCETESAPHLGLLMHDQAEPERRREATALSGGPLRIARHRGASASASLSCRALLDASRGLSGHSLAASDYVERATALSDARGALEEFFGEHRPKQVSLLDEGPLVRVNCSSHRCDILRGDHKSNTIYFLVNYAARTFVQKCYDAECRGAPQLSWLPLSAAGEINYEMDAACDRLVAAWPAAAPVPALARWAATAGNLVPLVN